MTRRPTPEPDLTHEQLMLAFRHLCRPGWPQHLGEALVHPLRGPCIRGLARCFARTPPPPPRTMVSPLLQRTGAPVPPTPTAPPKRRATAVSRHHVGADQVLDIRRAAANDFDDE